MPPCRNVDTTLLHGGLSFLTLLTQWADIQNSRIVLQVYIAEPSARYGFCLLAFTCWAIWLCVHSGHSAPGDIINTKP